MTIKAKAQTVTNRLFVFVGEKISVTPFEPELREGEIMLDAAFKAKYKVIETVFGKYDKDTIEFEVYDHRGVPAFSKFNFTLLYVSKGSDSILYHEKYMYSNVYKTTDGRWAGPYESDDYSHRYNKNTSVRPVPILFRDSIFFDIKEMDTVSIKRLYPEPYFKIENGKAYPIMGNYIQELFQLKRDGTLKARELF